MVIAPPTSKNPWKKRRPRKHVERFAVAEAIPSTLCPFGWTFGRSLAESCNGLGGDTLFPRRKNEESR
jgi:hypothetical protein